MIRLPRQRLRRRRCGLAGALTPVSGSWGSGQLFISKLVTALFVDNGPVFVGAVDPSVLYAAAGQQVSLT